jgi:hypothetical protein
MRRKGQGEDASDQHDAQQQGGGKRTERHEVERSHKIHAKCHDILPQGRTRPDHGFIATVDLNSMQAARRSHGRRIGNADAETCRCRGQRREKSN